MEFSEAIRNIYLITLSRAEPPEGTADQNGGFEEAEKALLRELYLYNHPTGSLASISTAQDTDIRLYLRER
jgi:hypothetical protein